MCVCGNKTFEVLRASSAELKCGERRSWRGCKGQWRWWNSEGSKATEGSERRSVVAFASESSLGLYWEGEWQKGENGGREASS